VLHAHFPLAQFSAYFVRRRPVVVAEKKLPHFSAYGRLHALTNQTVHPASETNQMIGSIEPRDRITSHVDVSSSKLSKVLFRASRAHRAVLISVSLALSQTPAEAARPGIRG